MIVTDHIGHQFLLEKPPIRIVSLVPSITELLHDLNLSDQIVGRTKFCIYPEGGYPKAKIIGGTKNVHIDLVLALKPDLIIANKEENVKEQIESLQSYCNTFTTEIKNVNDAIAMISTLGIITGRKKESGELVEKISAARTAPLANPTKVCYLIWQKPYMTVGADTYIFNFLKEFDFINCLPLSLRYPEITLEEIIEHSPSIILLSSEPFPFKSSHAEDLKQKTGIPTMLIDGSYCSWYGSRLLPAYNYMKSLRQQIMS